MFSRIIRLITFFRMLFTPSLKGTDVFHAYFKTLSFSSRATRRHGFLLVKPAITTMWKRPIPLYVPIHGPFSATFATLYHPLWFRYEWSFISQASFFNNFLV